MSSILTNASAMTALQTLQATNKNLETTQGRIATGQRVATASDNAAYWSIATTMRSDNSAMGTVRDALGLGAAQVDVAYTAMDAVKSTLDTIKEKLVAASQPDVDKDKIQAEITQLQNDLKTYAGSASFSGGNWLDVNGTSEQNIVASYTRDGDNNINLGHITVDTSKTALFNSADNSGILEQAITIDPFDTTDVAVEAGTAATAAGEEITATMTGIADLSLNAGETLSFTVGGEDVEIVASTGMDSAAIMAEINTALDTAGIVAAYSAADNGTFTFTATSTGTEALTITAPTIDPAEVDEDADPVSVSNFKITNATTGAELNAYLSAVETALGSVTTAASDLGAIKTRVDNQQNFVKSIMDAVDRGVGQLVDADMNEESTRLQALQVQQQLGIQALSIANGSAQQILSLFR